MVNEVKGFRTLAAWRKAYDLTLVIYRLSRTFPREETYALSSQLQRAAVSVPANIAEGYERKSKKEYLQFLHISQGLLGEIETYLLLARDLGYIDEQSYCGANDLREETARILRGLIRAIEKAARTT